MSGNEIQISGLVVYGLTLILVVAGFLVARVAVLWARRRTRERGLT